MSGKKVREKRQIDELWVIVKELMQNQIDMHETLNKQGKIITIIVDQIKEEIENPVAIDSVQSKLKGRE